MEGMNKDFIWERIGSLRHFSVELACAVIGDHRNQ
jgi:hypothetical protein